MSGLPEGWVETTLGKVGNVITGKTPPKKNIEYWRDVRTIGRAIKKLQDSGRLKRNGSDKTGYWEIMGL